MVYVKILKFRRDDFLKCRCLTGRCVNYDESKCGHGGKKIKNGFSYDDKINILKNAFKTDLNIFGKEDDDEDTCDS